MLEHLLMFNVSWIMILFKDEGIYLPTYLQCLNMWMLFMFSVCNLLSIPGKKKKKTTETIIHWFRTCSYYFTLCFPVICLVLTERTLCEQCQRLSINLTGNHRVVRRLTMVLFKHLGAEIEPHILAGTKHKQN